MKTSQMDLAEIIGISTQSYYLKENGKREFTISVTFKIARVLGCTLNDLFNVNLKSKHEENLKTPDIERTTKLIDDIVGLLNELKDGIRIINLPIPLHTPI